MESNSRQRQSGKEWEIGFCRREVGTNSRREMGSRTLKAGSGQAGGKWALRQGRSGKYDHVSGTWAVIKDKGKE